MALRPQPGSSHVSRSRVRSRAKARAAPPAASAAAAAATDDADASSRRSPRGERGVARARRWHCCAWRRRLGRRVARGSRRRALSPLPRRRHHDSGPLGAGAQEDRRQPLAVTANYYEDMVSSASIDVELSASPYKETAQAEEPQRRLPARQVHLQRRLHQQQRAATTRPNTAFYSVSQDMFGDLTTDHAELQARLGPRLPRREGRRHRSSTSRTSAARTRTATHRV